MLTLPEKAPDWQTIIKRNFKEIFKGSQNALIQNLVEKSDDKYYYWDKIRSQPIPQEFNKEEIWAFIRFRRHTNSNRTPLMDIQGKPFTFWLTDQIQKNLHLIDQSTSGNLALYDPINEKKASAKYMIASLMEEAITSSQIEGAVATISEAKKMLLTNRRPKNQSEQMIYNNYRTMQAIKDLRKKELSVDLLLMLHRSISKDTLFSIEDEGRLRTSEDNVNIMTTYGDILFTPPPAEQVRARLEELCKFANDLSEKPYIHPVVKAIILHFWMGYIHPFVDGNGRMARTLFYWYLLKHKYWLFEYTSISKVILKKTTQYARAYLYSENDENDLTYFIHFNIGVIMTAVEELKEHIQQEREKNRLAGLEIEEHPDLNLRQTRMLQHIRQTPDAILTIKIHQKTNNLSYQTARTDLMELAEKGWLKQIKRGNKFYFMPNL